MIIIALTMILKDSEPLNMITRCLDSVIPYVSGAYLTINGSTKRETPAAKALKRDLTKYFKEKRFIHAHFSYIKWEDDFSKARNFNFSEVDPIFEYILWLDADDVLRGGKDLQKVAQEAHDRTFGAVFFNYLYRVEVKDGKVVDVLIEHLRERLVRNDWSYKWIAPIHETLIEQRETNKTDTGLLDVVHLSNEKRGDEAMQRNIRILEKQLSEQDRKDPRTLYYLAKCYFDLRNNESWNKAEKLIFKYLNGSEDNTPSGWSEERAQAYEYLAEMYRESKLINKAIKATANALIEDPKFPNFYVQMALNYLYLKDFVKAKFWASLSQHVPYPKTTIVLNPRDMRVRVLEVLFNSAVGLNNLEEAWAIAFKMSEMFPEDTIMKERLVKMTELRDNNKIAHKIIEVARYLNDKGQMDKLEGLVKAVPKEIEEEPVMLSLIRDFTPARKWEEDEVAILCGRGFEKWSPKNLSQGIGGSEEAVIHLSRELVKLGWRVTVYGDPQDDTGVYDGVTYLPYYKINMKDKFNIFVGWRSPAVFEEPWKFNKSYLWLHDVQNPNEYTQKRVDNINKIIPLSAWHRGNIPNVSDEKFMISGNGINIADFELLDKENIERDPFRVIYTSSYDRGLEHLLKIWPEVRKEVPQANLHVFYGWKLFEQFFSNNPERMAWMARINKMMEQDGVTHHGRVGQLDILRETFKSGIWAYPTHFEEISCITAMKCQAAGAIPVVCDYAALKETVQHGYRLDVSQRDIYDPQTKKDFTEMLVRALKGNQEEVRVPMMKWARERFSWESVAKQWDTEFRRDELKEAMDVISSKDEKLERYMPAQLQKKYDREQTY